MDDDRDLREWSHRARLFPLPRIVLFPHAILPLHIFEERYKQMTEDALADDQLVTIVQLLPNPPGHAGKSPRPAIAPVACLGQIIEHQRLPDGRFNFLLLGRKRVHLTREVPTDRPYRIAQARIIDDVPGAPEEPRRSELIACFRRAFERHDRMDEDLEALLKSQVPLGVLTDIFAHAMTMPVERKQALLAEPVVDRRVEVLLAQLGHDTREDLDLRRFPPPFSTN